MASTGLFKIALVFASLVATMELSDARPNTDRSGVFKYHPWDKLSGEQVQLDQVQLENKSRSKRWGLWGTGRRQCRCLNGVGAACYTTHMGGNRCD